MIQLARWKVENKHEHGRVFARRTRGGGSDRAATAHAAPNIYSKGLPGAGTAGRAGVYGRGYGMM